MILSEEKESLSGVVERYKQSLQQMKSSMHDDRYNSEQVEQLNR